MTDQAEKALALLHQAKDARQSFEMADTWTAGERAGVEALEKKAAEAMEAAGLGPTAEEKEAVRKARALQSYSRAFAAWKEAKREQLESAMRTELAVLRGDPHQDPAKHYERRVKSAYTNLVYAVSQLK